MFFSQKSKIRIMKDLCRNFVTSEIRHFEPTVLCSRDDDQGPNDHLLDISIRAIEAARGLTLEALREKSSRHADAVYYEVFPGEHYRLLAALARTLSPASAIEIGTFTGMGSAALLEGLPEKSRLTTFDIVRWDKFDTHLDSEDFKSGRISQYLDDLSEQDKFEKHAGLFSRSQLIFCDAPKDGKFESLFLSNLSKIRFEADCLLILDDIRLLNMIDTWRSIQSPKLDLTSFGHWSGTGLVDIRDGLVLK